MPQKEQKENDNFSGFIAVYQNGKEVREKENYFSKKLDKKCATNWSEINKDKLVALRILWHGQEKMVIDKYPKNKEARYKELEPGDWFFSQSGIFDLSTHSIKVISRNIGFKKDGMYTIYSVEEDTGILKISYRKAD